MKISKTEREQAIARLREWIKPGDTVYTVLRHVSASGMSREIGIVLLQHADGKNVDLHPNYAVSSAIGHSVNKRGDAIKVSGCGMDMGYHIVYNLSRVLFADGFECTGKGCPSNDHSNGDRNYEPHKHSDPGYALNHRWL